MKGCRAIENDEIEKIKQYYNEIIGDEIIDKSDLHTRNKTIFFMGLYSGFRISELLSLKLGDVYKFGKINDSVYLKRENTKKKVAGRTGIINSYCKPYLEEYINHYNLNNLDKSLFFSVKGGGLKPRQVQKIYNDLFNHLQMDGKLSTHSTRKTFAKKVYEAVDENLIDLKQSLGHCSVSSTEKYIAFNNQRVNSALDNLNF